MRCRWLYCILSIPFIIFLLLLLLPSYNFHSKKPANSLFKRSSSKNLSVSTWKPLYERKKIVEKERKCKDYMHCVDFQLPRNDDAVDDAALAGLELMNARIEKERCNSFMRIQTIFVLNDFTWNIKKSPILKSLSMEILLYRCK